MRSLMPAGIQKGLPRLPDKLQLLTGVAMVATVIALYIITNFSFGSAAVGSASSERNTVIEKAKEYVKDNFIGLASIELESESATEEDGVWKIILKCVKREAGSRDAGGERVTLRLFVDEGSSQVRGLTTDGW